MSSRFASTRWCRIEEVPRCSLRGARWYPVAFVARIAVIKEYLVKVNKRRAFWSLNEDILKIKDSDYQYAVSIKEDTAYLCLYSPKTTKETRSIRRIQRRPIRRIGDME
ncbi:hypothetical protein Tco_1567701 [Tanacetum coccineum]